MLEDIVRGSLLVSSLWHMANDAEELDTIDVNLDEVICIMICTNEYYVMRCKAQVEI